MFFRKKNDGLFEKLEKRLQILENRIGAGTEKLESLNAGMGRLQSAVNKHDMSIEDLLEVWEERQSDEHDIKERLQELKQGEQHLLELFEAYQEQFWNLKRFAEGRDEAWASQVALMENNLEHYRQLCGIVIIGERGTQVDYDLHEVVETVSTEDSALDKRIADVYCCGYIYKGNIKKKARVAAYLAGKP